jgi:hypothetical protein
MDAHAIRDRGEVSERRALVGDAVHLIAAGQEVLCEMTACETGDAGDQHTQQGRIVPRMVR